MVYSGGPPRNRESWEAWFVTAFRYIESARALLDTYYDVADYTAKHGVEVAFKGLIESKLGYVPNRFLRGSEGHSILGLWEYVIENGWLTEDDVPKFIAEVPAHTNLATEGGKSLVNCITGMIAARARALACAQVSLYSLI